MDKKEVSILSMKEYKDYIREDLQDEFAKMVGKNRDFYGRGCIITACQAMRNLKDGLSPKKAWESADLSQHSGMSAAITATIIARYSPRGKEFKAWCIKDDVVMVDWNED